MNDYTIFPAINATLNGMSAVLLATGRVFIRRRQMPAHRACMIGAVAASALFFVSYIYYHAHVGSVRFQGIGAWRTVYFSILTTHTILAATVPPLAIVTLTRGLRARYDRHRALARWAYPVWMYVSVTGVVIYLMLYHF